MFDFSNANGCCIPEVNIFKILSAFVGSCWSFSILSLSLSADDAMKRQKPRRRDPQLGVVTFEQMREIFAQHARTSGTSMLTQKQLVDYWVTLEVDADVNPESNPPRAAAPKSRAAGPVHRTVWLDTAMVPASGSASSSAPAGLQLLSPQPGSNTTVPAWSSTAMVPWVPASGAKQLSVKCACCAKLTLAPRPPDAPPPGFEAVLSCSDCSAWIQNGVNEGFDFSTSFHSVRAWHQR